MFEIFVDAVIVAALLLLVAQPKTQQPQAEPIPALEVLEVLAEADEELEPVELDAAIALADELIEICKAIEPVAVPQSVGSAVANYSIRDLKRIAMDWNRANPDLKVASYSSLPKAKLEAALKAQGAIV